MEPAGEVRVGCGIGEREVTVLEEKEKVRKGCNPEKQRVNVLEHRSFEKACYNYMGVGRSCVFSHSLLHQSLSVHAFKSATTYLHYFHSN